METLTAWRWKQQREGNKTINERRLRVWEGLGRRSWNESSHSLLPNAVWQVEHGTFCHPAERWSSVYFQSLPFHRVSKCVLCPVSRHTSCGVSVQTFPAYQSVLTQPTHTYSSYTHGHTQAALSVAEPSGGHVWLPGNKVRPRGKSLTSFLRESSRIQVVCTRRQRRGSTYQDGRNNMQVKSWDTKISVSQETGE